MGLSVGHVEKRYKRGLLKIMLDRAYCLSTGITDLVFESFIEFLKKGPVGKPQV